jgi:hypothetical protein
MVLVSDAFIRIGTILVDCVRTVNLLPNLFP